MNATGDMSHWAILLWVVAAGLMVWFGIRTIKNNPDLFSKANLSKSFGTVAWLTLIIIVVIAFCVLMLKI